MRRGWAFVAVIAVLSVTGKPVYAQGGTELATATLQIQGSQLSIYSDPDQGVDDADQVLNIAEPGRIRTCYGAVGASCGDVQPGDPRVAGLVVRGDLSGPELPQTQVLETVPGGSFLIPGFQRAGSYSLQNIRLVEQASGRVIGYSQPSSARLEVHQILLSQVSVSRLSLEELRQRGIDLNQENFQAFDFAVGFAIEGTDVFFDLPVIYTENGTVEILDQPTVRLDQLPADTAGIVNRWTPPIITPFALSIPDIEYLEITEPEYEVLEFPLFGAIVVPGSVTFLNQFFDAELVVANGAPPDSGVELGSLHATLNLPSGEVVRVHASQPAAVPGQPVPILRPETQSPDLLEGENGTASWTLEGLEVGTHILSMDIEGELRRPGREPIAVASHALAAVDVVDARFHLTFSHPDVVREGSDYTLYVTVGNRSSVAQNLVSIQLRDQHITGAHKADPDDEFIRTIDTLEPGATETVEFELISDLNGEVVASTFITDSGSATGSIQLYTGVGELGIPLSPATLRLPRFTERLGTPWMADDGFLGAVNRFLGLAYSLAVAPATMVPDGLSPVGTTSVEDLAADLGFAGQRTFLGEANLATLEVLALDWLGNRAPRPGIDALRRVTEKGASVGVELAGLIRAEQDALGLGARQLWDHYLDTVSYTDPHLAAMALPTATDPLPILELRRVVDGGWTYAVYPGDDPAAIRTLPYGEVLEVSRLAGGPAEIPLALVGHMDPGPGDDPDPDPGHEADQVEVWLHNPDQETAAGRLLVLAPDDDGGYREIDTGVIEVAPGEVLALTVSAVMDDGEFGLRDPFDAASGQLPVSVRSVALPQFSLIGARQDYGIPENLYGNGVSYLFNRPPDADSGTDPTRYRIDSTFSGQDTTGDDVEFSGVLTGEAAFLQPSGRVVNVRYDGPLNAMENLEGTGPLVQHEHQTGAGAFELDDRHGNPLAFPIPDPLVEWERGHQVGLVAGKVFRGDGDPVSGATVELIRPRRLDCSGLSELVLDRVATDTTDATGWFFFEAVEQPHPDCRVEDNYMLRATVPEGDDPQLEPAVVEELSSTIRLPGLLDHVNIALLGRGTISGVLRWADTGEPIEDGTVLATSSLFNEAATRPVDPDGSFHLAALPVGPITLTGRDADGRAVYATVEISAPGDHREVILELPRDVPRLGDVVVRVLRQSGGADPPPPVEVSGAEVAVFIDGSLVTRGTTNPVGLYRANDVPVGNLTVQAADWRISRSSAMADLQLSEGDTAEVTLTLVETSPRTVTGRVRYHNPVTNAFEWVEGAVVFISGPGISAATDSDGRYVLEGVPTQGETENLWVEAIDWNRRLQGRMALPEILDSSPDVISVADLTLQEYQGAVHGIVLDPFGRPVQGAMVVATKGLPLKFALTGADGSYAFAGLPTGDWEIIATVGSGLEADTIGWFGETETEVHAGLDRFVPVTMVGGGRIQLSVTTEDGNWISGAEVYTRRLMYRPTSYDIGVEPNFGRFETNQVGHAEIPAPVGPVELVVNHPFHGQRNLRADIQWPGQVREVNVVFADAGSVSGQVVDVDGTTPVPGASVLLTTETLSPQSQTCDELGRFHFELVPEGHFEVTAHATVGMVDRSGIVHGQVNSATSDFEVVVRLQAQGTVRGQVFSEVNGDVQPLPYARVTVYEGSFPKRTLPAMGGGFVADAEGRYEVSGISAGNVGVIGRDPNNSGKQGRVHGRIETDWEVVDLPDLILSNEFGAIEVLVRDPETGAPLPDCQLTLRGSGAFGDGVAGVSGADGVGTFEALPFGTYRVVAFHAPSGRTGRRDGIVLDDPGERVETVVTVDQRGEIHGTLWFDETVSQAVPFGMVQLTGSTAGGSLRALASTSGQTTTLGEFDFLGIPEGTFDLEAAVTGSSRRADATVTLTSSAPVVQGVNLILEPVGSIHVQLMERLSGSVVEVDPSDGLFTVQLGQGLAYAHTLTAPTSGSPGHYYGFDDVLVSRSATVTVQENGGERRTGSMTIADPSATGTTPANPLQILLTPRGTVRVTVLAPSGDPVEGASVKMAASGLDQFVQLATDSLGQAVFTAVPEGEFSVTATAPGALAGRVTGEIANDDDIFDLVIQLESSVSAEGIVYEPSLGDLHAADPATWIPVEGAFVELLVAGGATQRMMTDANGTFRFDALPEGAAYTVTATHPDVDGQRTRTGNLAGTLTTISPLVLDISRPQVVSVVPPSGMEEVSRWASVEITFSEAMSSAILDPAGGAVAAGYFSIERAGGGSPAGGWDWYWDDDGRPVVRFEPSQALESYTLYSLTVSEHVADAEGRKLGSRVGTSFRTSDVEGPEVLRTEPDLSRPFPEDGVVRVDFNEAVAAASDDPSVIEATALVEWLDGSGAWGEIPPVVWFTREHYSLAVDPEWEPYDLADDTGIRRITVRDLADAKDNVMDEWSAVFRMTDATAPTVDVLQTDPAVPDGRLAAGTPVMITPALGAVDSFGWSGGQVDPPLPQGDVERVEYFFEDPELPDAPGQADYEAATHPWQFSFVAAYTGDGVAPREFDIWVRAVDTSGNVGPAAKLDLEIEPNQPPTIAGVEPIATSPVAGVPYAGSTLAVTVTGLADPDDAQLSLWADLRLVDGTFVDRSETMTVLRPASGVWADLTPPQLTVHIPMELDEGAGLHVHAIAADSGGAQTTVVSDLVSVADDQEAPEISNLVARHADTLLADTAFTIGETFVVECTASDLQTEVLEVRMRLDRTDLFPDPVVVSRIGGSAVYRSAELVVPYDLVTQPETVVMTVEADDRGANTATAATTFEVAPEADPEIPTVEWLSPWMAAPWPADYTSVVAPGEGVALLLRVAAADLSVDGDDQVPGEIAAVELRGPVRLGDEITLAETPLAATLVAGTGSPGAGHYQAVWRVPDGIASGTAVPFEARVVDTGGHAVMRRIELQTVAARRVYEAVQTAVLPGDDMVAAGATGHGAVFLLDGASLALYPPADGGPRTFGDLAVYAGGNPATGAVHATTLSAPEVTSTASSILYYPLELVVTNLLAVGADAGIDVSGDGLMGCDDGDCPVLPGQTASAQAAGGSHGGRGWFGSPSGGWDRLDLRQPGSAYGAIRSPSLPGGGGGWDGVRVGGRGGGVVRIDAAGARVHLAGSLRADGRTGNAGGGAGGSIWLRAAALSGTGSVSASGGPGSDSYRHGGGAGGRIALVVDDPVDIDALADRCVVSGADRGASGTLYLDSALPGQDPDGIGTLVMTQSSSGGVTQIPALREASVLEIRPADGVIVVAGEPFFGDPSGARLVVAIQDGAVASILTVYGVETPGDGTTSVRVSADQADLQNLSDLLTGGEDLVARSRERLSRLVAEGPVRLDAAAELAIGAAGDPDPVLDDRSSLELSASARVRLRAEQPTLTVTAEPPTGSAVLPGSQVVATWSASDPLGVWQVKGAWPLDENGAGHALGADQISVIDQSDSWTVPIAAPAGETGMGYEYLGLGGGTFSAGIQFVVLEDETPPTVAVDFTPVTAGDVYVSGGGLAIAADASDDVIVEFLSLQFDGLTRTSSGAPVELAWIAPPVTERTEYVATVEARDHAGNSTVVTRSLWVDPQDNANAPVVAISCPSGRGPALAGVPATLWFDATDDESVHSYQLLVDGQPVGDPVVVDEASVSTTLAWTPPADAPVGTSFVLSVQAQDYGNNIGVASVILEIIDGTAVTGGGALGPVGASGLDVVLAGGEFVASGAVDLATLTILPAASLTTEAENRLDITADEISVECRAAIDASDTGYGTDSSYPGAAVGTHDSGGSHLGVGGVQTGYYSSTAGATYGSVYRPLELGAGGATQVDEQRGGGAIRIVADSMRVDGAIRADGKGQREAAGAGGSVWITVAGELSGEGQIRANGGTPWSSNSSERAGGGGAVAIEYGSATGAVLANTQAVGGECSAEVGNGGAGTVYLYRDSVSTFGDLIVDNRDLVGQKTRLPSLGGGVAEAGSAGAVLETGRAAIQPYFEGHWVEVSSGGVLKGTWRIVAVDGGTLTLEANAEDGDPMVAVGDAWHGVYRFDSVEIRGTNTLESDDPIRTPEQRILGVVELERITADRLVVASGAVLSPPAGSSLDVQVAGEVVVEEGGLIDASARGYDTDNSYPGAAVGTHDSGGSHLGVGGVQTGYYSSTAGATYGSVYRPLEFGAGGATQVDEQRGGGAIRIVADSMRVDGAIRADGKGQREAAGAGGSVWITVAGELSGEGQIRANGGTPWSSNSSERAGGGGAVAIEYGSATGAVLANTQAVGGECSAEVGNGGAGTVYLYRDGVSTFGDLIVANRDLVGQKTRLPSLGGGVAEAGSAGAVLETGRAAIQPYFEGHWVEVSSGGVLKGTWRIVAVDGGTLTLEANAEDGDPMVAVGDAWQGVYRFDTVTVRGSARLEAPEPTRVTGDLVVEDGSTAVFANTGGPAIEPSAVQITVHDGAFWVGGAAGTVTDSDGLGSAQLRNTVSGATASLVVAGDGSFPATAIAGASGDTVAVEATDGHPWPETSSAPVGALPGNDGAPLVEQTAIQTAVLDAATVTVTGTAGALADGELPIAVTVANLTGGGSASTTAAPDGSFALQVGAVVFDELELTAVDGHPEPQSAVLALGEVADETPPEIQAGLFQVTVHDQSYWLSTTGPAITDDAGIAAAYAVEGTNPTLHQPLSVDGDGTVLESAIVGPEDGGLTVVVTDLGGNTTEAPLAITLPANDGPPTFGGAIHVLVTTGLDAYEVDGRTLGDPATGIVNSPDGLAEVRWEIRTPPFEAAVPAPVTSMIGSNGAADLEPMWITGAVGDELWIVAADDHPHGQSAEAQPLALPTLDGAPVVDLGLVSVVGQPDGYRIAGGPDAVVDAHGPITITATAWRQVDSTWTAVGEITSQVASGASFDLATLEGAIEGDLLVLTLADSAADGPFVNRYRWGALPAQVQAPLIDPALFTLHVEQCTPRLEGAAGAVTTTDGPITVAVALDHPTVDLTDPTPVSVDSGVPFGSDLTALEPGTEVTVTATDASGRSSSRLVATVWNGPPTVHVGDLGLLRFSDGRLRLGIQGPDITDRVNPVEVTFRNLHPDRLDEVTTQLPCDGGWGEMTLMTQPGDPVEMEACNGDQGQLCTGPIDLGFAPLGELVRFDLGGQGVVDLHRRGPGVLVVTSNGDGRWLKTVDLGLHGNTLVPSHGDLRAMVGPAWWGLGVVDGPSVYYWDSGHGIETEVLPFGDGATVDAALKRQGHLFVAGRNGDDIQVAAVAVDSRDSRVMCAPRAVSTVLSGTDLKPLALLPLGPARVGLLLDGSAAAGDGPPTILALDLSNPAAIAPSGEDTSAVLDVTPEAAVVEARLEEGELVLRTADGQILLYEYQRPWEWTRRAAFGQRAGAWPTALTLWADTAWVGYDTGDLVGYTLAAGFDPAPAEAVAIAHPNDPITSLVTANRALVVGLSSGLLAYRLEAHEIAPELHPIGVRSDGVRVSLDGTGVWTGDQGATLRAEGQGLDSFGDPAAASVDLATVNPNEWRVLTADLPTEVGGVDQITWHTLALDNHGSSFTDSIALADAVNGPPFLDPFCHVGVFSCGITTGAAGPGWRASAPDYRDPIWLRYRYAVDDQWIGHGFGSTSAIRHLTSRGNVMLASSNELLVADLADVDQPHLVGRAPFGGAEVGPAEITDSGVHAVVASGAGLQAAVVDLADPHNPTVVTPAQTILDGTGTVTDVHDDGEGSVWLLAAGPDRLVRLDATVLPTLSVLESLPLDPPGRPEALDSGRFTSAALGGDVAALFVARRNVGLELYDRSGLQSGVLTTIPVDGTARDLFVADLDQGLRVLVATGFDRGVVEASWDEELETWTTRWLSDLGDVRAFAFAGDAYRPGEETPETCQDIDHLDLKSAVSSNGTPRLYAITDAGILHVDTDIQEATFGVPDITLDANRIALDQSGCEPVLTASAGAIEVATGPAEVTVTVAGEDDRTWVSAPVLVDSGVPFDVVLAAVGPGDHVVLEISDSDASGPNTLTETVLTVPDAPPTVDIPAVTFEFSDGFATVFVPDSAIQDRTSEISLRLANGTTGDGPGLADPCDAPDGIATGSVPAFTGDPIQVEACNREPVPDGREVCTGLLTIGSVGGDPPLLTDSPITGLERIGPTVTVSTEAGSTSYVSLTDPWNPQLSSWSIPSSGIVVWHGASSALIAGDGIERYVAPGVLDERVEPLGTGVTIQGVAWFGNHLMVAGAGSDGIRIAAVAVDRSDGRVAGEPGPWTVLSDTAGLDVLALFTLGDNRVGLVVDDPFLPVRIAPPVSGDVPWSEPDEVALALPSLSGTPVSASVEDDGLAVWTADQTLHVYRLAHSGNPVEFLGTQEPVDGTTPTSHAIRAGNQLVGFSDGNIGEWSGAFGYDYGRIAVSGAAISGLVESHGVTIASSGRRLIVDALDRGEAAEISRNAIRVSEQTFSIAPGGATGPSGGFVLEMWGDGSDAQGDPASATWRPSDAITRLWETMTFEIPAEVDGITDIAWGGGWVYGVVSPGAEYFAAASDFAVGVPFPDAACTADQTTGDADLLATGPGWRAWATSGQDTVFTRWTDGVRWYDGTIAAAAVNDLRSTPGGNLLVAGDRLWIVEAVDSATPLLTQVDPFDGLRVEAVVAISDSVAVAATFDGPLSAVRVDLDAGAVLPPGRVHVTDSWGPVVALETNGVDVWMVTFAPNRILRLDGDDLTTLEWTESWLAHHAATMVPLRHPDTMAPFDAVLVLGPTGDQNTLIVYDGANLAGGEFMSAGVGRVSDLAGVECPEGTRVVGVGGLNTGLREVQIDLGDGGWATVEPIGDHGDVRSTVYQTSPFREGSRVDERCQTVRDQSDAPLADAECAGTLFVLTEAGVLATDHQLCECGSQAPEVVVDLENVSLDLSGCQPMLVAQDGAVVGDGPITVQAEIDNSLVGGDSSSSEPRAISSGEAFSVPLYSVDSGSRVLLHATPAEGDTVSTVVDTVDSGWIFEVDASQVAIAFEDGWATVTLPYAALSWRLRDVFVEVTTDSTSGSTAGTCPDSEGPYVASLEASPLEDIWLSVCTGSTEDFCFLERINSTKSQPGAGPDVE